MVRKGYTSFLMVLCWPQPVTCLQFSYKGDWNILGSPRISTTVTVTPTWACLGLLISKLEQTWFKRGMSSVLALHTQAWGLKWGYINDNKPNSLILWILSVAFIVSCIKSPPQIVFLSIPRAPETNFIRHPTSLLFPSFLLLASVQDSTIHPCHYKQRSVH